jgi:hypothetical protein
MHHRHWRAADGLDTALERRRQCLRTSRVAELQLAHALSE